MSSPTNEELGLPSSRTGHDELGTIDRSDRRVPICWVDPTRLQSAVSGQVGVVIDHAAARIEQTAHRSCSPYPTTWYETPASSRRICNMVGDGGIGSCRVGWIEFENVMSVNVSGGYDKNSNGKTSKASHPGRGKPQESLRPKPSSLSGFPIVVTHSDPKVGLRPDSEESSRSLRSGPGANSRSGDLELMPSRRLRQVERGVNFRGLQIIFASWPRWAGRRCPESPPVDCTPAE